MTTTLRACFATVLILLASASLAQAPDAGPPYRVGGNVTRPERISGEDPQYTALARKGRVQGVVIVEAVIDEEGKVTDAKVLKGLPMGLDESALEAVKTWKFEPATLDGKPVPVYYTLTVNFALEEEEPNFLQARDVFWEFVRKHPELDAHLSAVRREEALAYVQGLPDSSEVHFARAFILTGMRRYPEASKEIEGVNQGPEREMLKQLFLLYHLRDYRIKTIDAALQAATEALEANPDSKEAMLKKSGLLREKAQLMESGPERDAVLDEADQLEKRASPPK
jgi:TonB family protein